MPQNVTVAQKHGTVVQNTHCSVFVSVVLWQPYGKTEQLCKKGTVVQKRNSGTKHTVVLFRMRKNGTAVPQNGTVGQKHGSVVQNMEQWYKNTVPFWFRCS